jgi:hypothetical protein
VKTDRCRARLSNHHIASDVVRSTTKLDAWGKIQVTVCMDTRAEKLFVFLRGDELGRKRCVRPMVSVLN